MRISSFIVSFALTALAMVSASCADLDPCTRGTEGCACRLPSRIDLAHPICDDGMLCAAGTCFVPEPTNGATVCHDACAYRQDGHCDDGAEGSEDAFCNMGSDCSDCGPRDNPCAGTADPVFCPQTPKDRVDGTPLCWPAITDCLAVRYCGNEDTPVGCQAGQAVDCTQPSASRCVLSTSCPSQAPQRCVEEGICSGAYLDCNTDTACGANTHVLCYAGEQVVCTAGAASCSPIVTP